MKYRRLAPFAADYDHLPAEYQALFMESVHKMIEASRGEPNHIPHWPASLRVKPVQGLAGVYEMTWSFAGPDGRATFDFVTEGGALILR